jgi:hypothetical protein
MQQSRKRFAQHRRNPSQYSVGSKLSSLCVRNAAVTSATGLEQTSMLECLVFITERANSAPKPGKEEINTRCDFIGHHAER